MLYIVQTRLVTQSERGGGEIAFAPNALFDDAQAGLSTAQISELVAAGVLLPKAVADARAEVEKFRVAAMAKAEAEVKRVEAEYKAAAAKAGATASAPEAPASKKPGKPDYK